jgi:hypothetical protein
MSIVANTDRAPAWHGVALLSAVFLLTFAGALDFSMRVANPVVTEDAWYFMDVFVARDLAGELTWNDFFLKRDTADHSQPLHRLLLWANTHWFGLDFWYEGIASILMLAVCILMLLRIARRGASPDLGDAAIAALIPLLLFSLNSQEVYFWPLVGLFYLVLPFALLAFTTAAAGRRLPVVALAVACMMITMDGAGLLAGLAIALALILAGLRGRAWSKVLPTAAVILGTCVLYKLIYYTVMPPVAPAAALSLGETFHALTNGLDTAWKWFVIPAAASLAHWDHFVRWYGDDALRMTVIVGSGVLALHLGFWVSVLRGDARDDRTVTAVALMLFAYAMVAGVLLGRVPRLGVDYLWQHRYITGYQLANVALVLQWLAVRASRRATGTSKATWSDIGPLAVFAGVAMLQVQLTTIADRQAPYIREYSANMAITLHCLGAHRTTGQVICQPNHQVCSWSTDTRARLVGLLVDHQLNVFSPEFQRRHGMAPDPARADVCLAQTPATSP